MNKFLVFEDLPKDIQEDWIVDCGSWQEAKNVFDAKEVLAVPDEGDEAWFVLNDTVFDGLAKAGGAIKEAKATFDVLVHEGRFREARELFYAVAFPPDNDEEIGLPPQEPMTQARPIFTWREYKEGRLILR